MKKKFNWFAALFAATVLAFFAGCEAEADLVTDTTPPAKVTIAEKAATAGNGSVLLSWTNPADEDFYAVKISFEPAVEGVTQPVLIQGEKGQSVSHLVGGLTNGTTYTFSLVSLDKTLNESEAVTTDCTPVYVADTTPPAVVTKLSAEAKSEAVVLTWTDPADEDLFGIEISWEEKPDTTAAAVSMRAITQMEQNTVFVAPGVQRARIPNLTPETAYTFTVKAMDKSGNKSEGVTTSATPLAEGETMKIVLSSPPDLSNTTITVTAKITSIGNVEKVVYKKDGSLSAKTLLDDEEAADAVQREGDNSVWTFAVTENGTYTVAALDSDGREETMQHTVNELDFVAQNEVKNLEAVYDKSANKITFTWEIPDPVNEYDSPYDYALISYTSTDSSGTSAPSEPVKIENSETTYTVENIDSSKTYYTFTVQAVDKLGNESTGTHRLIAPSAPEGLAYAPGGTIVGATNENNYTGVFIEGRTVTLSPFYMAKYPVTKAQYREIMSNASLNTQGLTADPSSSTSAPTTYVIASGETDDNRPVECVTWYDAVYFCNLLSRSEGLDEVYTISNITTSTRGSRTYISGATVTMVMTKNGYRLPTEAEWEYAARGGNPNSADWNYTFSGADTASGVVHNAIMNSGLDAVGWYLYNICNSGVTGDVAKSGTAGYGTHEVGLKAANALGIYDMSGNVYEWCWDLYESISTGTVSDPTGPLSGVWRVNRGGSWNDASYRAPVCGRNESTQSNYYNDIGFRVVRSAN